MARASIYGGLGAKPLVGGQAGDILKLEVHNAKGICDHFCKHWKI